MNPKRRAKEWARAYGGKERVEFVKRLPCAGCGKRNLSENAHTVNGGRGRKADAKTIAPLCSDWPYGKYAIIGCHTRYDQHLPPFDTEEAREKIKAAAAETQKRWLEFSGESAE